MANSHMTFGVDLLPKTTNTYNLGNSNQKWNVWINQINGNAPITSASLVSTTQLTNAAIAATEVANRVYPVALDTNGKLAVNVPWTDTTYSFDGTYNSSTNKAATVSTVTNAINALDGGTIGSQGVGKTITALSQTNGNISATFENIQITKSQISDFPEFSGSWQGEVINKSQLFDARLYNNDRNSYLYTSGISFKDKNDLLTGFLGQKISDTGEITTRLAARKYHRNSTDYYTTNVFSISVTKDGETTYDVSSPKNFRSAINAARLITLTKTGISSLPYTITNADITAAMIVTNYQVTPYVGDLTISTTDGSLTISGELISGKTIDVVLNLVG